MGSAIFTKSLFRISIIPILCIFIAYIHIANSQLSTTTSRAQCNSACEGQRSESLCANNGITYPNMCRFDCAKARNRRLRVVRTGTCQYASLNDYRRGSG